MTTLALKSYLTRAQAQFETHHDYTSAVRQRAIADLAIVINMAMLGLYFLSIDGLGWHLTVPQPAGVAVVVLWSLGLLGMVGSSSVPGLVMRSLRGLNVVPVFEERDEPAWMSTSRKYLYYPSAYLTFIAIAIWVELSGGLVFSPFTAVFFTAILGAQQLSRYKLNSRLFILFGVLVTCLLALFETTIGIPSQPTPPAELNFFILAGAFLTTAVCTHVAKPVNYRARGVFPNPTHVELYQGGKDQRWRFSIYHAGTRLDHVLDAASVSSMSQAQEQVTAIALELCSGEQQRMEWRAQNGGIEAMGYFQPQD